jgi:predicted PurR-regulated permease PerM
MATRRKRSSGFAGIPVHEPFIIVERNPQVVTAICLTVLAIIGFCVALYVARAFLLPIATALVFSVILAPICSRIEWFRIPRAIAALLALILAGATVYAGFSFIAQPAARWMENAPQTLKKAERHLSKLREPLKPLQDISDEVGNLQIVPNNTPRSRTVVVEGPALTQSLLASAQVIVVQTGFVFLLAYFFLLTREEFRLKIIAFQPTLRRRVRAARTFRDMRRRVAGYIVTFAMINLGVGIATGLACWQLGLPEPAMWGGIAALLSFVPFVGPMITIGILILAGLSTFDTLVQASLPALAFWAISTIESNAVTPLVMGRRMTLNPLAIILSVSFWTWMWGPVGGLISLPLLIMFKVICDHTPAFRVVGALIGAPLVRDRGAEEPAAGRAPALEETPASHIPTASPESGPESGLEPEPELPPELKQALEKAARLPPPAAVPA